MVFPPLCGCIVSIVSTTSALFCTNLTRNETIKSCIPHMVWIARTQEDDQPQMIFQFCYTMGDM